MPAFSKGFCQLPHASHFYFISRRLTRTRQVAPAAFRKTERCSCLFGADRDAWKCSVCRMFSPVVYSSKELSELIPSSVLCLMLLLSLLLLLLLSPIDCNLAHARWLDPFLIYRPSFHRLRSAFPASFCPIVVLATNKCLSSVEWGVVACVYDVS